MRLHDCAPAASLPQIDPVFGLNIIFQTLSSFRTNKHNASLGQQFSKTGTTFQAQVYNTTKIYTSAPQNLQSVFSTDFVSWSVAPRRPFLFRPFVRKRIMTVDGPFRAHSPYSVHVNHLMTALSKHDGLDIDLKPCFEKLALDSSTEFLLGHSTCSLTLLPTLDAHGFLQAYNYGQAGIGKRMQLPQWNILTRDLRLWRSCTLTHQQDIVNQLLNVFQPAHDATAVALTNIFFHLLRHHDAYTALREEIIAGDQYTTWTFVRPKACKYLQAVTNETFRLNPSMGQMNRVALRDTVLPNG
ncbi:MAG: hypothetical protein Q9182_004367 [Xanthomendoza sp. 2 TL-2023]